MSRAISAGGEAGASDGSNRSYWRESEAPLASLLFLLPLIVIYEVGTRYFTTAAQHGRGQQIIAFTMMQRLFRLFGVNGQHLPALAVVVILLAWHIARKDRWSFNLYNLLGMAVESAALALPLLALGRVLARYFPLSAIHGGRHDMIIMSVGAGVYEELVFRLMLFSLLSLLLKDAIQLGTFTTHLGVVVGSGLLFAAYHYLSPSEHFMLRTFLFRTAAGAYFGLLFLLRGFGITAASHAAYDILILFL
jgi:hypothetical protein